jgi:hypothetical protein
MKSIFIVLIGTGILLPLVGCSNSTDPVQSGAGTMQINMVDSPASYDAVNIVVDSVQAHIATSDSSGGWTTLNRTSTTYNLLDLVNGRSTIIGTAKLPVGRYSQIRLYVGSGSTVVVSGQTNSLVTPSGSQSGIKLNVDATIIADETYILTIDFDANRSIVKSGSPSSPMYHLKPVIRVLTTGTTGFIAGTVLPTSTIPTLSAYSTAPDTISTAADTNGAFKFIYVNPGTYTLYIASNDALYYDSTMTNINVTALNTTNLGTITLRHK